MTQLELGKATIVYEDQDGENVEETVDNEQLVYARDHWMVKSGTDDQGNDLMKQIPIQRVHHVDRNVQKFEEQARTVRHRVETFANDLRKKIPMDVGDGRQGGGGRSPQSGGQSQTIPVEEGDRSDQ